MAIPPNPIAKVVYAEVHCRGTIVGCPRLVLVDVDCPRCAEGREDPWLIFHVIVTLRPLGRRPTDPNRLRFLHRLGGVVPEALEYGLVNDEIGSQR